MQTLFSVPLVEVAARFHRTCLGWRETLRDCYVHSGLFLSADGNTIRSCGPGLLDPNTNAAARPDQMAIQITGRHTRQPVVQHCGIADPGVMGCCPERPSRQIRGPGIQRWDLSVQELQIDRDCGFQFRLESFNVFNHTNFESHRHEPSERHAGKVLTTRSTTHRATGSQVQFLIHRTEQAGDLRYDLEIT